MKKILRREKVTKNVTIKKSRTISTSTSTSIASKRRRSSEISETKVLKKVATLETVSGSFSVFTKAHVQWREHGTILIGQCSPKDGEVEARSKIAAFDLDLTLIKINGTHRYPKDEHDWVWLTKQVPKQLNHLYSEGFKIVIFSNQYQLGQDRKDWEKKRKNFQRKIGHIANALNIPFQVFASTERDYFRKPLPGMWECLVESENAGVAIDKENSFFVGDAAGRDKGWKEGAPKDWTDTDRKFAENINIKFFVPEEFFENAKAIPYSYGDFDPKKIPNDVPLFAPETGTLIPEDKRCEVVIFVGMPGCGKSTFACQYLVANGYTHVNQDTLKTKAKCIKCCGESLKIGKPVVIDNTNPDFDSRQPYIELGKTHNVPIRCFWFQASEALAKHNNMYRACGSSNDVKSNPPKLIPDIAYNTYKSRFKQPVIREGFDEIMMINFLFEGSDAERHRWERWHL